jgi:hypothetical protein
VIRAARPGAVAAGVAVRSMRVIFPVLSCGAGTG